MFTATGFTCKTASSAAGAIRIAGSKTSLPRSAMASCIEVRTVLRVSGYSHSVAYMHLRDVGTFVKHRTLIGGADYDYF